MIFRTDRAQRIQQQAQHYIDNGDFASIAWRVNQHGRTLTEGLAGFNDTDTKTPLSADAIYRIYSMTKPVVSLVALQLIEEGQLTLGTHISQFLPAFASMSVLGADGKQASIDTPITVEHLLMHTAGFSYDFQPDCAVAALYRQSEISSNAGRSLANAIDALAELPLASQPGKRWFYSVATDVLAHLLEVVTDTPLPDLLRQRVFSRLDMRDTGFHVETKSVSRLLPMYGSRDLGMEAMPGVTTNDLTLINVDQTYPVDQSSAFSRGGHGLYSTTDDYMRFASVLHDGRTPDGESLLSAPMVNQMWQNRLHHNLLPIGISFNQMPGYGWNLLGRVMIDTAQADRLTVTGEGGWSGAASTYFWVDRENDLTGIIMTQYLGSAIALGMMMQSTVYQSFVSGNAST